MTAHIVTPLTVRDAEIVSAGAVGMPGEFSRAGVIERVTALVMRVDVAAREQAWADKGGPELLAALKSVEWDGEPINDTWPACPSCCNDRRDGHADGCVLAAAIAKAEGR